METLGTWGIIGLIIGLLVVAILIAGLVKWVIAGIGKGTWALFKGTTSLVGKIIGWIWYLAKIVLVLIVAVALCYVGYEIVSSLINHTPLFN